MRADLGGGVRWPGLGWAIGMAQDDPGQASFRFDYGRQTVVGVVFSEPSPHVRVVKGSKRIPAGHTLMITAGGKFSVLARAKRLEGQLATVSGVLLKRGDLDMMQVRGGKGGMKPAGPLAFGGRDLRRQVPGRCHAPRPRHRAQGLREPVPDRRYPTGVCLHPTD
ncbi:MAG: hypothetical protein ACKVGZ_01360 [Alphaproteobacteria bacterium]